MASELDISQAQISKLESEVFFLNHLEWELLVSSMKVSKNIVYTHDEFARFVEGCFLKLKKQKRYSLELDWVKKVNEICEFSQNAK